jgi:hypothetical protein
MLMVALAHADSPCHGGNASGARLGNASGTRVGRPTATVAWRAGLHGSTDVYAQTADGTMRRRGAVGLGQASWLLVLDAIPSGGRRCWVRVRLPWRPNDASGWLAADQVRLEPTAWSIVVSRARRTLTVDRGGVAVERASVVIGAPGTPTPTGLFAVIGAWPSPPSSFFGAWILTLTAHSNVLRRFDGGNGRTGIHGRGGASLLDPLGSALSHGCIRLANRAIRLLVRAIGSQLPGTPVWIS